MFRLIAPRNEIMGSRWLALGHFQRLAIILWTVVIGASCVRAAYCHLPRHRGIFPVYAAAGQHWCQGIDLYGQTDGWDQFIYSPLAAVFFVPFGAVPEALGSTAFRLVLSATYLGAVAWWCRSAFDPPLGRTARALIFLLVIPLAADTVLSAQAGGFVGALLLLCLAAAADERWTVAAICAALAAYLKVYPAAVGLLLSVCYPRRFAGRFTLALLAGLAMPFLFGTPDYVAHQYAGWIAILRTSNRHVWDLAIANRDVELLFRVWLTPLPPLLCQAVQLLTAMAVAGVCLAGRRAGWPDKRLLLLLGGLAACWMTLFGPVVETFTYILVTPTLAGLLVTAWREPRSWWYRGLLLTSWAIFTGATMAVWFPNATRLHSLGTHPIAGLFLLAALVAEIARGKNQAAIVREQPIMLRAA